MCNAGQPLKVGIEIGGNWGWLEDWLSHPSLMLTPGQGSRRSART